MIQSAPVGFQRCTMRETKLFTVRETDLIWLGRGPIGEGRYQVQRIEKKNSQGTASDFFVAGPEARDREVCKTHPWCCVAMVFSVNFFYQNAEQCSLQEALRKCGKKCKTHRSKFLLQCSFLMTTRTRTDPPIHFCKLLPPRTLQAEEFTLQNPASLENHMQSAGIFF